MSNKHTPSVNIIRDADKHMDYIVTPNGEKAALKIFNDFNKGFHSFSIIGSYGTGKSSFLWALEQTLKGNKIFDAELFDSMNKIEIVNLVGSYNSLIEAFNEEFNAVRTGLEPPIPNLPEPIITVHTKQLHSLQKRS